MITVGKYLWNIFQHKVSPVPIRAVSPLLSGIFTPLWPFFEAGGLVVEYSIDSFILAVFFTAESIYFISSSCFFNLSAPFWVFYHKLIFHKEYFPAITIYPGYSQFTFILSSNVYQSILNIKGMCWRRRLAITVPYQMRK